MAAATAGISPTQEAALLTEAVPAPETSPAPAPEPEPPAPAPEPEPQPPAPEPRVPEPRATPAAVSRRPAARSEQERPVVATRPDIVLIEEDREQGRTPAPAGDLFTGPLFTRAKAYARWTGAPWFILSGEFGLLDPEQIVGPYERRLLTSSAEYRAAWGAWTVARLELLAGSLRRVRVEVHAATPGASEALRPHLLGFGAYVMEPLRGLSVADRITWYDGTVPRNAGVPTYPTGSGADPFTALLGDASRAVRPSELLAGIDPTLRRPGLYSWFVDEVGATQLSAGLGSRVAPGLVWIGQAGAVRPGSGLNSSMTLRNQIAWVDLGRSIRLSPLRRTLGAILFRDPGSGVTSEDALTEWIQAHLRVAIVAAEDVEHLAEAAERVAAHLVPQLSPDHAEPGVRMGLREARTAFNGFTG
ncbi:DUF6884 domain-containing protein [Raineyella fluvialis]|uniref:DUF6884 domain-containing protein n=1 Tax=Raineyella fluvialis TaxID=2662261 RepID=A0A5Q2FCC5_9ACTN|nr:DUF6884 domain-containing protein [Raineyella fluvialis]QGF23397.1 hypothetical protein Rai3103_06655 [Raineyella fluvialis]